jgi:CHAD domain-containing protein
MLQPQPVTALAAIAAQGVCGETLTRGSLRLSLPVTDLWAGEPEAVHDLRVATRRMRATLRLFRDVLRTRDRRALQRQVRRLTRLLGGPRQADVGLELLDALVADLPAELRASAAACRRALELRRDRHRALLRRSLDAGRMRELRESILALAGPLLLSARAAFAGPPARAPSELVGAWLLPRLRAEVLAWQAACPADAASPSEWHRFRVASKRLRYALEAGAPADPAGFGPELAVLKELQETLGHQHDLVALAGDLEDVARWLARTGALADAAGTRLLAAQVATLAAAVDPRAHTARARAALAFCASLAG